MADYCYSVDGEDFSFDDIDEVIISAFENASTASTPKEIYIYRGVSSRFAVSDWVRVDLDDAMSRAFEEYGDHAESFLTDVTKEQEDSLKASIRGVVDAWAEKHNHKCHFWGVSEVECLKVCINGDLNEGGTYQVFSAEDGSLIDG